MYIKQHILLLTLTNHLFYNIVPYTLKIAMSHPHMVHRQLYPRS